MIVTRYTEDEFREAVRNSFSIAQVLKKIGVRPSGGNYDCAHRRIERMELDISHFTGAGHLKGKTHNWAKKTALSDILVENFLGGIGTHKIKLRLIKEGLLLKKCYVCGISEWRGQQLSLELEHKNGNRHDNRIENLELLCPNCHSLTATYRGRGKRQVCVPKRKEKFGIEDNIAIDIPREELQKMIIEEPIKNVCKKIGFSYRETIRYLRKNSFIIPSSRQKNETKRKFNVSKEELEKLISTTSMLAIGRMFGVSGNAVRKRAKLFGILDKACRKYTTKEIK